MPQPFLEIDFAVLDALLQFKVSAEFCANHLGISRDTLYRRIKENTGMTFSEYHNLKKEGTATKLQQKAIYLALEKGDKDMIKFLLKNFADFSDKVETKTELVGRIEIDETDKGV